MNLLNYIPGNSFLHKLNPITRLLSAFLFGVSCIMCNNVWAEVGLIIFMIIISAICGMLERALRLVKTLFVLGLLMFFIQLFFVRSGDPLLVINGFCLFTRGGLDSAFLLSFRVIGTMLPLMLLFAFTQMNDLCNAMVKKMHVPYRYAFIVTTAFRFVPLFSQEFHEIQDAQKARGVDFDTKNIIRKIQLIAPLCVPLLVSSLKKVDSSAISAEMRGFNKRTTDCGYKDYPFIASDYITIFFLIALLVVVGIFFK